MRTDFRLEDWVIRPRRGCIQRGDEIVQIHPKPMAVLECLAAAKGEVVRREEIFDTVWPGVIVSDDALAQCVVELRKAFGDSARDARVIRTVPKIGFCLVPPVTELEQDPPVFGGKLRLVAYAVLVLIAALVAFYLLTLTDKESRLPVTAGKTGTSIAVLPFVNRSSRPGDEYFSDGMHDELLSRLSRIPNLKVISRTSVNQYRNTQKSLPEIADELSVETVLEGSVQRAGEQVRINVQLIKAQSDGHLWAETYDSELVNIFEVQDNISSAIVAAIESRLGIVMEDGPQISRTSNTAAHDAYLRGRYLVNKRTSADIEAAISEFERAIQLDPEYAIAHAELAMSLILASSWYFAVIPRAEAMSRAVIHAEQALALDPDLAEARAASGRISWMDGAYEEALTAFDRAIQINPSYSIVHSWKALILGNLGQYKDMYMQQEQALRLDPLSLVAMGNYVHSLIERNQLNLAGRELEKTRAIDPGFYAEYRGRLQAADGKWAALAIGNLERLSIDPDDRRARGFLAGGLTLIGLEQEALALSNEHSPWQLIALGRSQDAIRAAEANLSEAPANNTNASGILGNTLAAAGEYALARPLLEEMWERSKRRVTFRPFGPEEAAALIAIRRQFGEENKVDELLGAQRDNIRRLREAGFTTTFYFSTDFVEGLTVYQAGKRAEGLALIARASENGYFITPNMAWRQSLFDDPGFAPILAKQQARQLHERERFLNIVCHGNPYEAVWQPLEETCDAL